MVKLSIAMAHPNVLPPPLVTGQRMDVDEFIRRWDALPDLKDAELIDGVVYVASPVGRPHGRFDLRFHSWLDEYRNATPGVDAGCNVTFLTVGSAPQPDSYLCILPEFGGATQAEGRLPRGAPELVAEVCDTSTPHDLGPKLALYQRAGVREYITYEVGPQRLTWRTLGRDGSYHKLRPQPDGSLRSREFPGLWLEPMALIEDRSLLPMLRKGLRSPDHKAFRALMRSRAPRK